VALTGIPGSPPDLANLPTGCRFQPRCPSALQRCSTDEPLLYDVHGVLARCLLHEPLARRRHVLAELCTELQVPEVLFSPAVVGQGHAAYAAALTHGHEGVLAKHLASTYRPGRRSAAWRKLKPRQRLPPRTPASVPDSRKDSGPR
jgi:hypothetical protein